MNKEILRLAIPNILSNISVPLLSTVDTALMGRLSDVHIGAVGVGAMIFNFIYWNFGFLRMGTTGMTAQAYGKKDNTAIAATLGRALVVVLILAGLILLLRMPLSTLGVQLMNVEGQQAELVRQYFEIRVWAAPATLALYALMGWFFGMQNAIIPLILTLIINVVNIGLSYAFIHYWNMEVDGVAWGTVIAQYVGLLMAGVFFVWKYRGYIANFRRKTLFEIQELLRFLNINKDIFIRTFCLTFVFGFFYSQSAKGGELILAVNVILLQFLNWMSYGVDGFAFASESLVGKYHGAQDTARLRRAIRLSFVWAMALAVCFSVVYGVGGAAIMCLFTDKMYVIEASKTYLFWMVILPIIGTPCYIWDGIFVGLTASKAMRDTMLLSLLIFMLSFWSVQQFSTWHNHGLWIALLLFLGARGGLQALWYRKGWSM